LFRKLIETDISCYEGAYSGREVSHNTQIKTSC